MVETNLTKLVEYLEEKTGLNKFYIYTVGGGLMSMISLFLFGSQFLCTLILIGYPLDVTSALLQTEDNAVECQEWKKWLAYWLTFSTMTYTEFNFGLTQYPYFWIPKVIFLLGFEGFYERIRPIFNNMTTANVDIRRAVDSAGERLACSIN